MNVKCILLYFSSALFVLRRFCMYFCIQAEILSWDLFADIIVVACNVGPFSTESKLMQSIRSICTKHTQVHSNKSHSDRANFIESICDNKLHKGEEKVKRCGWNEDFAAKFANSWNTHVQLHFWDKKHWHSICIMYVLLVDRPEMRILYVITLNTKTPLHWESIFLNKDNTFGSSQSNISINR